MKNLNNLRSMLFILTGVLMILASGCKKDKAASIETTPVTYLSDQSVMCSGNIYDDGGAAVSERGICYGTTPNPTTAQSKVQAGSGTGFYTCTLTGLIQNTGYYVRAYAINSAGTAYGPEFRFRTWNAGMATDIDGNLYHMVTINNQVWMVENLKTTRYRNGEAIDLVTDNAAWEGLTSGAYCEYNNDPVQADQYGRLYNWFAVNDGRLLAPEGWRIPSEEEWTEMTNYLGGEPIAGGKLKEVGFTHWNEPNSGATNETGFTALPGGHRDYGGIYFYINEGGGWWCSTEANYNDAVIRYMDFGDQNVWNYLEDKRYGRSVRCIKD